jgi:hypothetical protein
LLYFILIISHRYGGDVWKNGDSLPIILDKAVDFMASTQAFKEYMK